MFARDWVSERYVPLIRETLSGVLGRDCEVIITVDPEASPPPEAPAHIPDPTYAHSSEPEDGANDSRLNPAFTFSTFVVGNSSRFAHAACRAVAEAPGKAYNPLFLYGGVGLGKTHLMHAIGHAVRETHRNAKVAYVTSEKFMNEMVASIVENRPAEFRMRYRGVDVLLIDDIQFLAGKDHTREEFFHTFNALQEFQKQIVVSSDRPPKDIPTLEDRLRSRFEGGLMADIQPPDFETRLAILTTKLGPYSKLVPDEVCSLIAHRIQKNIRELEGALIRVLAHASINGQQITLETAQQILRDVIPVQDSTPVSIETIQLAVAAHYSISVEEMKGKRRDKNIVFPRQVAMYLIREATEFLSRSSAALSGDAITPPRCTRSKRSPSSCAKMFDSRARCERSASSCTTVDNPVRGARDGVWTKCATPLAVDNRWTTDATCAHVSNALRSSDEIAFRVVPHVPTTTSSTDI